MNDRITKVCPNCNTKFETDAKFCPHDSAVLVENPEALVGSTLDNLYRIEKLLGRGGMGAVYLARHAVLGDMVAIKILKSGMENNEVWLRRFQREGKAARRFKHPNAVVVHDLRVSTDGTTYMVLEYVDGPNLRDDLKRRGRYEPAELMPILEQLSDVLDAGHAAGVVHRDLKPDNVMLATDSRGRPVVKLLDMGIAKLREVSESMPAAESVLTVAGQIIGTPHYMSPEQWGEVPRDGSREIDGRADVYSFAIMVYELLTGTWPVTGTTVQELRHAHVTGTLVPLRRVRPDLPEAAERVLAKGMARDRAHRYATAGALVADLAAALANPDALRAPDVSEPPPHPQTMPIASKGHAGTELQRPARETAADTSGADAPASYGDATTDVDAAPTTGQEIVPRPEPRRTPRGALWGVAAAVVLGGAALAYWVVPDAKRTVDAPPPPAPPREAAAAPVPRLSYYLETTGEGGGPRRVDGTAPLVVTESFKFHFTAPEDGYLYVVGYGEAGVPRTFLTARPAPESGVTTNRVEKNLEYVFPSGERQWIGLDEKTMTTPFTVVFSRSPLAEPAFFADQANRPLTVEEQAAFEDFKKRHAEGRPAPAIADDPPLVTLAARPDDDVVVADVVVKHLPKSN
jgi:serine/threonine protein kinase